MCGGSLHTLYFSSAPIDKNRKHPHIRIESKVSDGNWLYFGNYITLCKYTFSKKMPEMCGWRRKHFQRPLLKSMWIFLFEILHNCRLSCSGDIAFDFPAGTWTTSGCHRQPPCCWRHLSERQGIHMWFKSSKVARHGKTALLLQIITEYICRAKFLEITLFFNHDLHCCTIHVN